ncbi:hypothetical protein D9758_009173 [Tetrapyrgos nigripes]|uniref:Uncharacterized protein n=1 Tax=Tetrapyrgos nigripes TaxID=182062 RepID=A0A8H5G8F7_9AGAR|nr:hypothetical protein D9758_009173 [Tetrapyrgos nigripes]
MFFLPLLPPFNLHLIIFPEMFSTSFLTLVALAATAIVQAIPLATRQANTCTPNAQGSGVSVVSLANPALELGVATSSISGTRLVSSSFRGIAAPEFHIQQDGQASFVVRDVTNNNLAVTFVTAQDLELQTASNSGNNVNQLWEITCNTCLTPGAPVTRGTVVGNNCRVRARGNNLVCVNIGQSAGAPVSASACNGGVAQEFKIVA